MTARFICRQDPQGYWRISYRDGQLLAQGKWADMLALIRAIHGRTLPEYRHPDRKNNAT